MSPAANPFVVDLTEVEAALTALAARTFHVSAQTHQQVQIPVWVWVCVWPYQHSQPSSMTQQQHRAARQAVKQFPPPFFLPWGGGPP